MDNLANRTETIRTLNDLPSLETVSFDIVLATVEDHRLHGLGVGFVDAQIVASALAVPGVRIWTRD